MLLFVYLSVLCVFHCTDTVSTLATGLSRPTAIAYTPSSSLAFVLTETQLLTMPLWGGVTSVLAGQAWVYGFADGQGTAAKFDWAKALVIHPVTNVIYIVEQHNNRIRACTSTGLVSTFAGSGIAGNVDGEALTAQFSGPVGIVMDPASIYIYVTSAYKIRRVTVSTGYTITIAGSGAATSIDGTGSAASLNGPAYVGGDVYYNEVF